MAVPPALVVSMTFNPPDIAIVGPISESTIMKLNEIIPELATVSHRGRKAPPKFERHSHPVGHWTMTLRHLMFNELSQMAVMLALMDCIESEGDWSIRNTHAVAFSDMDTYKFFFTKKAR